MNMKKILGIVLSIAMVSSMCSCVDDDNKHEDDDKHEDSSSKSYVITTTEELSVESAETLAGIYCKNHINEAPGMQDVDDTFIKECTYEGLSYDNKHRFYIVGSYFVRDDYYDNIIDTGTFTAEVEVGNDRVATGKIWDHPEGLYN